MEQFDVYVLGRIYSSICYTVSGDHRDLCGIFPAKLDVSGDMDKFYESNKLRSK
jgi:hypothetical protein